MALKKMVIPLSVPGLITVGILAFISSWIPALVCFSVFERRIVGGLTGAVKGWTEDHDVEEES